MRFFTSSLGIVPLLLIAACGIGPSRSEAPTVHMIEWSGQLESGAERRSIALLVHTPAAYPGYESSRMAYRQEKHSLRYFAYNRWADAPARLIGAALTEALSESRLFADVAAPGSRIEAAYRLDTDLIRLEQIFSDAGSVVRLTIRYRLVDLESGGSLGSLHHDIVETSTSDDPRGGVAAANQAFKRSVEGLIVELAGWVRA